MKKAKIIVPAIALLALGVAGSTLGTVAWYTANNAASVSAGVATGNVSSTTTSVNVGSFTLTPVITATDLSNVVLTDDEGKSAVINNGVNTYVSDASLLKRTGTCTIASFTVAYTPVEGEADHSTTELVTMWNTAIGAKTKVTLVPSDNTFAANNGITLGTGESGHSSDGGLKFYNSATISDWSGESVSIDILKADLQSSAVSGGTATVAFSSSTAGTVTLADGVVFEVGIKGLDSVAQDDWTYQLKVTPTVVA